MTRKTLMQGLAAACLFGLLAAPLAAGAAGLPDADSHFLQAAAAADAFQARAAALAHDRAASTEVRTFAAKMQSQHQAGAADLQRLARSKQVALPDKPEPADQRTLDGLAGKTGAAFDALYIDQVAVDAHVKTVALYQDAAKQAGDAQVREFAARAAPALADHLALARALKRDPAANQERMPPAAKDEPAAISPAAREAPASVAPTK
ncbi:DUF4142 domain-containing protein [Achromobacter sp. UMC71]|uniref:DUF4142 domain-containing protein n=1 Tax=Achromobacter sp. UMC71 TaxID=1862320 RepID=UPI0016028F08|nr:DUF4142 domain-containing protein [Achromobacter sp. UMC71]MBB1624726.1 hypothetical protein [Achromobacter sp. UMC71]